MDELCVSASHLRVHLKDLANHVAATGRRIAVYRHGYPMFAVVSQEDLAFLREHRPGVSPGATAGETKDSVSDDVLEHPESMPFEEVERVYRSTKGSTDKRVQLWRGKAYVVIKLRTGEYPDDPPWPTTVGEVDAPDPPPQ